MNVRRAVDPSAFDSGIWGTDSVPCPPDPILAAHVDGELDGARSTLLEEHLDRCRVCAAEVRRLEGLSGLLRAWDASRLDVVPPARLATRILRDVEVELGVRRAHAVADARRGVLAVAASVLLVFGAALLGVARSSAPSDSAGADPAAAAAQAAVDAVSGRRLALAASAPMLSGAPLGDLAAVVEATRRLSAPAPDVDLSVLSDPVATEVFARHAWLVDVEHRYGETFVLMPDGRALAGPTVEAFEQARRRGEWIAERARRLAEPDTHDATGVGVPLARLMPVPTEGHVAEFLRSGARVEEQATPARGGLVLRRLPEAVDAQKPDEVGGRVLDLSEAVRSGAVRMFEDPTPTPDSVWLQVQALDAPVLVPAGEVLSGGLATRVTTRGVWLPAGTDVYPVRLACRAVGPVSRGAKTAPVPTGAVAGPELRGALARGETAAGVLAIVRAQLRGAALDAEGSTADLLRLYTDDGPDLATRAHRLLEGLGSGTSAFVATDPSGRLQGAESVRLPGASSRAFLERLIAGYLAESRSRSVKDPARSGVQAEDVFSVLTVHPVRLATVSLARGRSLRVWSGDEPHTGVVFEAVPGDGDVPVLSSALVPDVR